MRAQRTVRYPRGCCSLNINSSPKIKSMVTTLTWRNASVKSKTKQSTEAPRTTPDIKHISEFSVRMHQINAFIVRVATERAHVRTRYVFYRLAFLQERGGRLSTVSCVRFYIVGGGRPSTVPCVRFDIAGGAVLCHSLRSISCRS